MPATSRPCPNSADALPATRLAHRRRGVAAGLTTAMGHYRHGVLFSPVTAEAVAGLVHGEPVPAAMAPFSPAPLSGVRP